MIKVGRGAIVNLQVLTEALQSGQTGGAGLDVFEEEPLPSEHPLWAKENVIVPLHVTGVPPPTEQRRQELIVENVQRFCAGESLLNVVDNTKGYVVESNSLWK